MTLKKEIQKARALCEKRMEILAGKCFSLQGENTHTHTHTQRERKKERKKEKERENGERQRESESAGKEREENDREVNVGENERIFSLEVFRVHGDGEEREAAKGSLREQTSESASAGGVQWDLIEIWFRKRLLFP